MEHTELLENEQIITESTNNVVTLTTHRVRYNSSSTGQAHIVSIMLEKVSSIEVHYKSFYFLLSNWDYVCHSRSSYWNGPR